MSTETRANPTHTPDAERVGNLRRRADAAEAIFAARRTLFDLETAEERALEAMGDDPAGVRPMWSAGR